MLETERVIREWEQSLDRALTDDEKDAMRRTLVYSAAEMHDAIAALFRPITDTVEAGVNSIAAALRKLPGRSKN